MADAPKAATEQEAPALRFLTFALGEAVYAIPAEDVSEVIRMPTVARVPQAPASLIGIANLRGSVLPLASLRGLLGQPVDEAPRSGRAIVMDGAAPVALAVDSVDALISVDAARVEIRQAELSAHAGERLRGAFDVPGRGVAKILDIQALLAEAFVRRTRTEGFRQTAAAGVDGVEAAQNERRKLVTFEVAGQEYALNLKAVREIVPVPPEVTQMPRTEDLALGVCAYRNTLLPLLSLRGLLGFAPAVASHGREKVLVVTVRGVLVGLVADRMRDILPADETLMEPTPLVLASRTGGEAQITAIYRADGGQRLVSILDPEKLFREDVMQRLGVGGEGGGGATPTEEATSHEVQFVVFRLGDDEYALPIEAVDEVAQVPDHITRLPKTPAFLEGVINLRGEVLPVVDQRRRFDLPTLVERAGRRLMVVRSDRHRAGLIVDSVSEVLRSRADAVEAAPALTDEAARLVRGVINLEATGRIVLVLDPSELLSQAERGLLDKLTSEAGDERP